MVILGKGYVVILEEERILLFYLENNDRTILLVVMGKHGTSYCPIIQSFKSLFTSADAQT